MKIGIISLPLNANYGGIMQAFALQTILKGLGHKVEHIEIKHKRLLEPKFPKSAFIFFKRFLKKTVGKWNYPILLERHINNIEEPICLQYTMAFVNKYINVRQINSFSEIKEADYDAYIVGSDQIWRPKYFKKISNAYLDFAEKWDVKRYAYAASLGVDFWEYTPSQTARCQLLIKKFNNITVREYDAKRLLHDYFGINDASVVLDPTLLLAPDDYLSVIDLSKVSSSRGDIFVYILDENDSKQKIIGHIANSLHRKTFKVGSRYSNIKAPLNERIQHPIEQWLKGFFDASFVITDSYHACVFSIIFRKPFVVIGNKKRGMARFQSLLDLLNLKDRIISSIDEYENIKYPDCIDDSVYTKLSQMKEYSLNKIRIWTK